jgi:hypothetical protein
MPVAGKAGPWWRYQKTRETRTLTGDDAMRAAGALLPRVNHGGGSEKQIQNAVGIIEDASAPAELFKRVARDQQSRVARGFGNPKRRQSLKRVPVELRLALEMASHEESERIALEGELHVLEEAWRQAEEIAGIADDMFLPESIDDDLLRLKGQRARDGGESS